jgi:tetratricopeptide (TPR) repeat protein
VINGRLELSLRHFPESKMASQQAINLADTQDKDIAVQAKYTLGLAQARSGAPRAGQFLCKEAVDIANGTGDPQLVSSASLAWAEAMLESGEAQRALETALRARESFTRFGQRESEWRAWLIAARASARLRQAAKAHEYASHASEALSYLEQKWGSEAYNGYITRKDIQRFLSQLDQVVKH